MQAVDTPLPEGRKVVINSFQLRCDRFSKQCTVLLAFFIPISTLATNAILLTLMISWLLAGSLSKKAKIIGAHPVARMSIALFLVFVIGAFYSNASTKNVVSMLGIGKMGKLLYIPFLLPLMTEEKWRRYALLAFVSALLLTLVLSLLKVYAHVPIPSRYSFATVFKDDIFTNLMMAFTSFVLGHYMFAHPNPYTRLLLFGVLMTMIFYVFFMSQGRSGYVVFLALWLLLCLQRFGFRGIMLGGVVLSAVIAAAASYSLPFKNRIFAAVENVQLYQTGHSNTSLGARLEFVKHTWDLSKQDFWFGFGTGSFKETYETYANSQDLIVTSNPHNEYLNILFQVGVFGLLAFLALLWVILKNSYLLPKPERWLAQGVLVAMLVGCFANSWIMDFTSGYFFVALTAICFGALNFKISKTRQFSGSSSLSKALSNKRLTRE